MRNIKTIILVVFLLPVLIYNILTYGKIETKVSKDNFENLHEIYIDTVILNNIEDYYINLARVDKEPSDTMCSKFKEIIRLEDSSSISLSFVAYMSCCCEGKFSDYTEDYFKVSIPKSKYETRSRSLTIAEGDINKDGKPDMIISAAHNAFGAAQGALDFFVYISKNNEYEFIDVIPFTRRTWVDELNGRIITGGASTEGAYCCPNYFYRGEIFYSEKLDSLLVINRYVSSIVKDGEYVESDSTLANVGF